MKRHLFFLTCSAALALLLLRVDGANAAAQPPVGTVVGAVLSTDIEAFVNGKRIPSMNVYGLTAVVAEDLRSYGFDVAWIPQTKQVAITNTSDKPVQPITQQQSAGMPVGAKLGNVYYTDIKANYEGTEIPSYNIGGRTVIMLNDLAQMGNVEWNEKEKKLSFTPRKTTAIAVPAPLVLREKEAVPLHNIVFGDDEITYQDKAVGKIVNGKPMLSLHWLSEALGYHIEPDSDNPDNIYVYDGRYGFTVSAGDMIVQRYWFGESVGSLKLAQQPVQADGEWYVDETSLKSLFGYLSSWNNDKRTIDMDYNTYIVEDYGVPTTVDNYYYHVEMLGAISGQGNIPRILITNSMNGLPPVGGVAGGGVNSEGDPAFKYSFASVTPAGIGTNELDIVMTIGERILYYRHVSAEMTIQTVKPIVDYTGQGRGRFSMLKSVNPEHSYMETSSDDITVSGIVSSKVGEGLTFTIEKSANGSYEKLSEATVLFEESGFQASIPLTGGNGLYRITATSLLTFPRGTSRIDVAKWYVRKGE